MVLRYVPVHPLPETHSSCCRHSCARYLFSAMSMSWPATISSAPLHPMHGRKVMAVCFLTTTSFVLSSWQAHMLTSYAGNSIRQMHSGGLSIGTPRYVCEGVCAVEGLLSRESTIRHDTKVMCTFGVGAYSSECRVKERSDCHVFSVLIRVSSTCRLI